MYKSLYLYYLAVTNAENQNVGKEISKYLHIIEYQSRGSWAVIRLAGNDNDGRESAMTRTKRRYITYPPICSSAPWFVSPRRIVREINRE